LASNGLADAQIVSEADSMSTTNAPLSQQVAEKLGEGTYTVANLAELLRCSERHIWRMCDLNKIPGKIRFGRLVRFSRAVVDAWLADAGKA